MVYFLTHFKNKLLEENSFEVLGEAKGLPLQHSVDAHGYRITWQNC